MEEEKYVYCGSCRVKYHNNEDSIKENFGYNRLNERFRSCIKCRKSRRGYYDNNREEVLALRKLWVDCEVCGSKVCRDGLPKHQRTNKCNKNQKYKLDGFQVNQPILS